MYQLSTLTFTRKEHLTLLLNSAIAIVLQFHHPPTHEDASLIPPPILIGGISKFSIRRENRCIALHLQHSFVAYLRY